MTLSATFRVPGASQSLRALHALRGTLRPLQAPQMCRSTRGRILRRSNMGAGHPDGSWACSHVLHRFDCIGWEPRRSDAADPIMGLRAGLKEDSVAAQHSGRLELTWTDKDKALLSIDDGKYGYTFAERSDPRVLEVRVLHEVDRFDVPVPDERPSDLPIPTTDNLLITGDAMHALDALRKIPEWAAKYIGKVKLVYIDPPFNTGQTFTNYDDNIDHSIWLTMLRDRLRQLKPLLSDDGSIWVHLDHVESHRCRVVLDEEFGIDNFVAEIAWQKADSPRSDNKGVSVSHDTIIIYRKTPAATFNRHPRTEAMNARFQSPDGDPEPWFDGDPTAASPGTIFGIQHPMTGDILYPGNGRFWAREQAWFFAQMSQYAEYELRDIHDTQKRAEIAGNRRVPENIDAIMLATDLESARHSARERMRAGSWPDIILRSGGEGGIGKKSRIPKTGRVPESWWPNSEVGHNREAKSEIKALFPGVNPFATPKPERLLQRIIHIATNPGDIVLDCFVGSGTSAAVAHKMGRRWVAIELVPETLENFAKPRLAKVVSGEDLGGVTALKERVDATEAGLPGGMTADDAQLFNRLLKQASEALNAFDEPTLRTLKAATRTRHRTTMLWHGGGGFAHVTVGPSMYDVDDETGEVFLSETAVNGNWSKSVAAQLSFTLTPHNPVFCGVRGKQRLAVIDGVADDVVVRTVVEHLAEKERAMIVAKVLLPNAEALLQELSPGSRLKKAPRDLFPRRTVK